MSKKTTSSKKAAANKANAGNSTGPKTARGKSKSRNNAFKHGLFALGPLPGEDAADFQEMLKAVMEERQPRTVEEVLRVKLKARSMMLLGRFLKKEQERLKHLIYAEARLAEADTGKKPTEGVLPDVYDEDVTHVVAEYIGSVDFYKSEEIIGRFLDAIERDDWRLYELRDQELEE